jgi:hypothetical protein
MSHHAEGGGEGEGVREMFPNVARGEGGGGLQSKEKVSRII